MTGGDLSPARGLVLGVVQGLTEFLPVSSTAHLRVVPAMLGWGDPGAAASAVIQLGTTLALVTYLRHDLWRIARGASGALWRGDWRDSELRMALGIALGSVPIVVAGPALKPWIENELRSLVVIVVSLAGFGLLLGWADRRSTARLEPRRVLGVADACLIGVAQAFALVPGASRSGTTMTGAMLLGFDRSLAARFSFLLSVPAVAGAGVFELWTERDALLGAGDGAGLAVATLSSAVVGYLALDGLLRFLRTHDTMGFVLYRLGLAAFVLVLASGGLR